MTGRVPPLVITPSRPNGRDRRPDGSLVATSSAKEVARAWEDFAAGEDVETGVRPEILASWYRCRDRYDVDRTLDVAPGARGDEAQGVDYGVIFTALGGVGALAGKEVERDGAVVTVTDGDGARPRRLGRPLRAAARRAAQPRAVVVVVRGVHGHERDGHVARGVRPGDRDGAGTLVPSVPPVGVRGHLGP